jgi:glycerol kinase
MRARHEVFGVADVPNTAHYRDNGWVEVDPSTPTSAQERRRVVNAARRGDLNELPAAEVVQAMGSLSDDDRETVVAAEKSGKARKTVLNAD